MSANKERASTKLFFSGVLALTLSNVIVKAIGLLLKIPLSYIVGDGGMGYFNSAYSIYTTFYMLCTSGLPVAVSIMVSESRVRNDTARIKRIFRVSLATFFAIGTVGMLLMMLGARPFAEYLMKSPDTAVCIIAIAPTLFFVCISGAMRGYFQGYQQLVPHAVSQVIEALCKLGVGVVMAIWSTRHYGVDLEKGVNLDKLPYVAAYTIMGLLIGVVLGMIYLTVSKLLFKATSYDEGVAVAAEPSESSAAGAILRRLIVIAIPITLSAAIPSLANLIDVVIMQRRLQDIGMTVDAANEIYGNYTTLAVPMFNLPPVLIYPISYAVIPYLTAARMEGDRKRMHVIMESTLRVAAIIAFPCALGLCAMSRQVLTLFYKSSSVELAAPMLALLAPSVFFVCMINVTSSFLQACKREKLTVVSMAAGAAVKLTTSYILIGIPAIGRFGTPIGTLLCYLTSTIISFYFVAKYADMTPRLTTTFLRPLAASVICVGAAVGAWYALSLLSSGRIITLLALVVAVIVYALVLFPMKAISREDLALVPKGAKICALLEKVHLLKKETPAPAEEK